MKSTNWKTGLICAVIMGVLTTFLCLIVADGIIGLNYPPARKHIGYVGAAVFWFGMIALPLIFHKWVKWRYTLMNLPLYYLLYFPIYEAFGPVSYTHLDVYKRQAETSGKRAGDQPPLFAEGGWDRHPSSVTTRSTGIS